MALEIGLMDDGIAVFVELPHFLLGTVGEDPHDGPGCWQREQAQHTRSTPPDE